METVPEESISQVKPFVPIKDDDEEVKLPSLQALSGRKDLPPLIRYQSEDERDTERKPVHELFYPRDNSRRSSLGTAA